MVRGFIYCLTLQNTFLDNCALIFGRMGAEFFGSDFDRYKQVKPILQEFYQPALRRKIYKPVETLQKDLDEWLEYYNNERSH